MVCRAVCGKMKTQCILDSKPVGVGANGFGSEPGGGAALLNMQKKGGYCEKNVVLLPESLNLLYILYGDCV